MLFTMEYRAEVVKNKKLIGQHNFKTFSHPNQVVRFVVSRYKGRLDSYAILVMNDLGDVWVFVVRDKNGNNHVRKMEKHSMVLQKNQIDMILTGNTTLLRLTL
jgi:hypothetical protein